RRLAGPPRPATPRRLDQTLVRGSRLLVLVALGSGVVWLLLRTAVFENRPQAALEPRAVWHAVLDTWPGLVWLARHGLLIVLGVFLAMRASTAERRGWLAAGGRAVHRASGAVDAIAQVESLAALAGTTHGRLLLAKLVVLVPILVLAAVNRTRILPALSAPSVPIGRSTMRHLTAFVGLEAVLALVLLGL